MPPPMEPDDTPRRGSRSFSTDVLLLTGVRFGAVGAAFVASVLAARFLGPAGLGAAAVAITVGTITSLIANAGLGISAVYYLGRRPEQRVEIVESIGTMTAVAMAVAAALVLVTAPFLFPVVLPGHEGGLPVAAAVLAAAAVATDVGSATLLGLHSRGRYMSVEIVRTFGVVIAAGAAFVIGLRTPEAYVVATAAASLASAGLAWAGCAALVGGMRPLMHRPFVADAMRMGLTGQAGNLLQFVNLRLDLLLVSAFLRAEAAGIYLVAVRVAEVVVQVANAVAAFIFPRVAAQLELSDTAATERAIRVTLAIVAVSALCVAIVSEPLLAIAFGPSFAAGTTTLRLALVAMIPLALSRILTGDLKGRGRPGLVSIANLIGLVLTAGLGVALIPWLGIEGAALGSIGAYAGLTIALLAAYRYVTRAPLRRLMPRPADAVAVWEIGRRSLR